MSSGDLVVAEVRWRGTHTGPLATPDGEVPATGRSIDLWGSNWSVWADGRMTHQRNHIDVLDVDDAARADPGVGARSTSTDPRSARPGGH